MIWENSLSVFPVPGKGLHKRAHSGTVDLKQLPFHHGGFPKVRYYIPISCLFYMFRGKSTRIFAILLPNEIFAAVLMLSGKEIHQDFFDVVIPSGVGILHPEGLQAKFSANLLFFLFSLPQDFLF